MPKSIYRPEYDILRQMIRQAREEATVTQVELSLRLERTQSFISDIETGTRRIDVLEVRDICQVIKCDFIVFMMAFEAKLLQLPANRRSSKVPRKAIKSKRSSNSR